jgi:dolichol-phosphate mannosyltransferase
MTNEVLIFIPTYNERENVEIMLQQLLELNLPADILFLDDNSPDGTGELLDALSARHPNVHIIHRSGKLGIGTAHVAGMNRAYDSGYRTLVTMDCDFTHMPTDIEKFIAVSGDADVVVGSRYMFKESLETWNLYRKFLTTTGHVLTRIFLKMPYDATGAFRLYKLDRLPREILVPIRSPGYSFFFESLYVIHLNGFKIREVAIDLPSRMYGHSKMRFSDAFHSLAFLMQTYFRTLVDRKSYEIATPISVSSEGAPIEPEGIPQVLD